MHLRRSMSYIVLVHRKPTKNKRTPYSNCCSTETVKPGTFQSIWSQLSLIQVPYSSNASTPCKSDIWTIFTIKIRLVSSFWFAYSIYTTGTCNFYKLHYVWLVCGNPHPLSLLFASNVFFMKGYNVRMCIKSNRSAAPEQLNKRVFWDNLCSFKKITE